MNDMERLLLGLDDSMGPADYLKHVKRQIWYYREAIADAEIHLTDLRHDLEKLTKHLEELNNEHHSEDSPRLPHDEGINEREDRAHPGDHDQP